MLLTIILLDYSGGVSEPEAVGLLWALRRAQQAFWAEISTGLERAGLDELPVRRVWVLEAIAEGADSPSALAGRLAVSRQAVTQNVDALVQAGYVERTASDTDRRRVSLALTARGTQATTVARRASGRVLTRLRTQLGREKVADLADILAALR
jgi:DNA-binding MarR family transcriptional regulator